MRIHRVRIEHFGALRDRDYTFDEGMTVFYGPNEAGKTTTLEFIRTILSPERKKKLYPERSKKDGGTLTYDEDGTDLTLKLDGKSIIGEHPRAMEDMDPEMYRSIFAMDIHSLDDSKGISEGEIRSRYLTIPGGDGIPVVKDYLDDSIKKTVGRRNGGNTELHRKVEEIARLEGRISELRSNTDEYGVLSEELELKGSELERLREESRAEEEIRRIHNLYESNRGNITHLSDLRKQRSDLGSFIAVSDEDVAKLDQLDVDILTLNNAKDDAEKRFNQMKEGLRGADVSKVIQRRDDIEEITDLIGGYLADLRTPVHPPEPIVTVEKRPNMPVVALGSILAVVGIALMTFTHYSLSLAVAGAAIALLGVVKGRKIIHTHEVPFVDVVTPRIKAYEERVHKISESIGISCDDIESTVRIMSSISRIASDFSAQEHSLLILRNEVLNANTAKAAFLVRFGGPQGFRVSRDKTEEAKRLDSSISQLEAALRNAGIDPAVPDCPVHWEDTGMMAEISALNRDMGTIKQKMDAILDMDELESCIDRLSVLESERDAIVRNAMTLLFEEYILEAACGRSFSEIQPDVIRTADRYLGCMTDGRYKLEIDPSSGDFTVIEGEDAKGENGWSSGLRAQILLSLKLAIALEMGGGRIPMILDDVLLPFDSQRKGGAIRALREISKEMQIIMFTCDAESRDIAQREGGISIEPM